MEPTFETQLEDKKPGFKDQLGAKTSAVKERLGKVGRSLKKVDLRETIATHPFAAVGIAAAAGAIIGLVRPAPQRGRVTSALIATLGAIGFRLVRDTAMRELGTYAKNYMLNRRDNMQSEAGAQTVEGGGIRYTPAL